jgi:phosphoribosylamine--glycine ligase
MDGSQQAAILGMGSGARVLVVGASARDHALVWKLAQSPLIGAIHAAPGNPGIGELATCHDVGLFDYPALTKLAVDLDVDLVIVALEDQLAEGLVDMMEQAGVRCFGPTKAAARIESSKRYSKELMREVGVPTAEWETHGSAEEALAAIDRLGAPIVVKVDGLAAGCGAVVCATKDEAARAVRNLAEQFPEAAECFVLEKMLSGSEMSLMVLCDGANVVALPPAQDSKRLLDGDEGPNTGGMGAFAPSSQLTPREVEDLVAVGVRPVVEELARRGTPFKGVLYTGFMFTSEGPRVLEYNCRFGNPETQALMRVLDADLYELLSATAHGRLNEVEVPRAHGAAVVVSPTIAEYPDVSIAEHSFEVHGIGAADELDGVEVFFGMGTAFDPNADVGLFTGGRPVTVSAWAETVDVARERAYAALDIIDFEGMHYRRDIAAVAATALQPA